MMHPFSDSPDAYEPSGKLQRNRQPADVPVVDHRPVLAIDILRGTNADLVLCCLSMVISLGFAGVGAFEMTDDDFVALVTLQSITSVAALSFTLCHIWRDCSMCKATDAATPSFEYCGFIAVFFVMAVGFAAYVLFEVAEWQDFYALTTVWVTVSAIVTSKTIRDRGFANRYSQLSLDGHSEHVMELASLCRDSLAFHLFMIVTGVLSVLIGVGGVWMFDKNDISLVIKLFLTLCYFWCLGSVVHVGKLLHERADPAKAREMSEQIGFQILVVLSTVVSFVVPLIVVLVLPRLPEPKRMYLLGGIGFMVFNSIFLVKHIRQRGMLLNLIG